MNDRRRPKPVYVSPGPLLPPGPYELHAADLLAMALDQLRSRIDPEPAISGARQCLLIDNGQAEPDEDLLAWDGRMSCWSGDL